MSRRDFIKATNGGQVFRLALFDDHTAKEWRLDAPETEAWSGSWKPVDLKTGRSIELSVAGYVTILEPKNDRLTGTQVKDGRYGEQVSLFCIQEGDPRSWLFM